MAFAPSDHASETALTAHKILVAAYHMVATGTPYRELGDAYLDHIGQTRTVANLKRRLERLGYRVSLEPNAAVA